VPLRVPDLGAHDGFVSAHVANRYRGELHIDGIELNERAGAIFNRRLGARGNAGTCKVGRAEDAPALLTPRRL
jgi:hypothetical protein